MLKAQTSQPVLEEPASWVPKSQNNKSKGRLWDKVGCSSFTLLYAKLTGMCRGGVFQTFSVTFGPKHHSRHSSLTCYHPQLFLDGLKNALETVSWLVSRKSGKVLKAQSNGLPPNNVFFLNTGSNPSKKYDAPPHFYTDKTGLRGESEREDMLSSLLKHHLIKPPHIPNLPPCSHPARP